MMADVADTAALNKTALLGQLNFLPVPEGTATLGLDQALADKFTRSYGEIWDEFYHRETPQHEVHITGFNLARFPVTNAIYSQFMAAGGYHEARLWTPEGWAWRVRVNRTQPVAWDTPKFAGVDKPVVGVSWFEAMALAQWASIETGLNVRLPTEAEWEWAARANNVRWLYPWGGVWDANKLNSGVAGVGSQNRGTTTPIGTFSPVGDGPFGHGDLLGQVWEWTSTAFAPYPYVSTDGRENPYVPEQRVLRGGNWSDGKYANRATTRYHYTPFYSDVSTGVRLAEGGSQAARLPRPKFDLVIYGRSTFCPDLVTAHKWLDAWGVPYRQLNIDQDEQAAHKLDAWIGSRTVPTFVVAAHNEIDPVSPPAEADLSHLRNMDRGSMLHEAEENTLRTFLVRNGFLAA